jgi:hypothetical protein
VLWEATHDHHSSSSTHSSAQPGGISPGQTLSPESNNYNKTEYTNTQQNLPVKKKLPLDMQNFWLVGLFCQKEYKVIDPYFQSFSSCSSGLIFTK